MRAFLLLVLVSACSTGSASTQHPQTASNVRFFGNPPPKDQTGRIGIENAPQTYTPPMKTTQRSSMIRTLWSTSIGKADAQTTMGFVNGLVVIGSHGSSPNANNEASDGVYILDGATGAIVRQIHTPGDGDLDVSGVAIDGERIIFASDNGQITSATIQGGIAWSTSMKGATVSAPALASLDEDKILDVVIGDGTGMLTALEGKSGRILWQRKMTSSIVGSPAIVDANGDGRSDVVAIDGQGLLGAYSGKDGSVIWTHRELESALSSPVVADLNADGKREVLATWEHGTMELLDLATGTVRWSTSVQHDNGAASTIVGTPIALSGNNVASIVVPTDDGIVVQAQHGRSYRSSDGRVTGSGVVARLEADGPLTAIFGSEEGDLVAVDTVGKRFQLAHLPSAIVAPAMLADGNKDGLLEIYVATANGSLVCLHSTAPAPAWIARFRDAQPDVDLGWRLKE